MPVIAQNTHYQRQLALQLLTPSMASGFLVAILTLVALAVPAWSFVEDSQPLFEFFYGAQGVVTSLQGSSADTEPLWTSLVALPAAYNAAIVLVSIGVGIVVFIALQLVNRITGGVASLLAVRSVRPSFKKVVEKEIEIRFAVRGITAVLWLLYWFVSVTVLWPFCILCVRTSIGQFPSGQGWGYVVFGFGLFALVLHLHVVFLRLIALRPRLFSTSVVAYK